MVQPFTQGTANDMFYCPPHVNCSKYELQGPSDACARDWGVRPRSEWARVAQQGPIQ